jgi:vacuolar protein sorting-associated protein 45
MQIKPDFQDIVLSARQDEFFRTNMYANYGDLGSAMKV